MELEQARLIWDEKYERGLPLLEKPDPFFVSAFDRFASTCFPDGGNALDLAGGMGRHALLLAQREWRVTVVDISSVAIGMLRKKARQRDLKLDTLAMDAKKYLFTSECFDLIAMFFYFDRGVVTEVLSMLKPGGLLIFKNSIVWKASEDAALLDTRPLESGEIVARFPVFQVLHHAERPVRNRGVVEYVGRKPSAEMFNSDGQTG